MKMVKKGQAKKRVGVVDTMFSRADMGKLCLHELQKSRKLIRIIRRTVPGIKDLGVEAKRLIELEKCDIVITLGMVGKAPIDKTCAHEAVQGIQLAQLLTNTHVMDVMVFEDEGQGSDEKLGEIMYDRVTKHAQNALDIIFEPQRLVKRAGTGQRQGSGNDSFFSLMKKKVKKE
jgi:riboflavin synthase